MVAIILAVQTIRIRYPLIYINTDFFVYFSFNIRRLYLRLIPLNAGAYFFALFYRKVSENRFSFRYFSRKLYFYVRL